MEKNRNEGEGNQLEELLSHELRKYPPSLAETDRATEEVRLRTGNKASLLNVMKKESRY